MAKKHKVKVFSFRGFDVAHYNSTEQFAALVHTLYDRATDEIAQAASKGGYNAGKPFSFADYPKVKAVVSSVVVKLATDVETVISKGSRKQWLFACQKNDDFLTSIIDKSKLSKAQVSKYQDRNLDALKSFQERKVGGMNLSERVWKYTEQYREQIEVGLDVGLGEGRSAGQLSIDLRQNLQDPDRLFRRVRDKRGNLQLSKAAKAFHPGTGVYRSSYKNAMRLTRSEINMAYRESDWLRWQQLDFVIGFEVKRSNREPMCECKLCERLIGKYPKWFKFKGWHPQCLCHAIPIIEDYGSKERSEDRRNTLRAALYGAEHKKYVSPNTITDLPDEFKAWVVENMEKQNNWTSTPYFIRDNFKGGRLAEGLIYEPTLKSTKPIKTAEQKADIQKRWDEHRKKQKLIQKTAENILTIAKDYNEIDFTGLQEAINNGSLTKIQIITKETAKAISEMKKQEKALSDIIPNVHEWHKQFTIAELKKVHSAVEAKLVSWENLTLSEQAKKLNFEIGWVEKNKKYSTWQPAQEAYKKYLNEIQYKIEKQAIEEAVIHSFSFAKTTKSDKVKQIVYELKSLLDSNAPIAELQIKTNALNSEVLKLEAAKLARRLRKLGKLGDGFTPDAYTQKRKDKAIWDKGNGKIADKALIDVASKNWIEATEDEKDRVYEYTHHYCNVNEPLQGRAYYGNQNRKDFEHRVNNITSYISKNVLPKDMWFMRGDDGLNVIASRIKFAGGTMPSNLQDLVGMTMQEGGFMSTSSRKGQGFIHKSVIINIYAPKGTKAAYIEPISAFGNGDRRDWDGKRRFKTFSSEHETLFQRGTQMRITKVYQAGDKIYIDCEIIGQEIKPLSYIKNSSIGY